MDVVLHEAWGFARTAAYQAPSSSSPLVPVSKGDGDMICAYLLASVFPQKEGVQKQQFHIEHQGPG